MPADHATVKAALHDVAEHHDSFLDRVTTRDYSRSMKSVGIRQLKSKLSEYVRLAREGETILVSHRDEVVAELGPVRRQPGTPRSLEETLERLADRGQLTRSGASKKGWSWKPATVGLEPEIVSKVLNDLRSDR